MHTQNDIHKQLPLPHTLTEVARKDSSRVWRFDGVGMSVAMNKVRDECPS